MYSEPCIDHEGCRLKLNGKFSNIDMENIGMMSLMGGLKLQGCPTMEHLDRELNSMDQSSDEKYSSPSKFFFMTNTKCTCC